MLAGMLPENALPGGPSGTPNILILLAHPDWPRSRANRKMLQAVQRAQPDSTAIVRLRDLCALYPDYDIDVAAEQAACEQADLIIWQHPVHWFAMPALMKLWVDEVLAEGWAYGSGGRALAGKALWAVLTSGGGAATLEPESHGSGYAAFLPPYRQTAHLIGMRFLPPLLLQGVHEMSDAALDQHARHYAQQLLGYPASF